jgi:DeoR/GlpR family transcriptional regulator of sugar metabolism
MTTEHWLSIVDYARMFNVSDMTVRRRIKAGKLPAKLIDQKYYIAVPSAQPQAPQPQSPQPM